MIKFVLFTVAITAVQCQYHQGGYHQQEGGYQQGGYQQAGGYHQGGYKEEAHDYYAEPHYNFQYAVNDPHTYDIHSQKEERKGDSTHGVYSLVEPDGSVRTVEYSVEGKSGFVAKVHREPGKYKPEASYKPAAQPSYYKPAPAYHQQQPSYHQPAYYH